MPKMRPDDLLALLDAEKSDALAAQQASKLSQDRETAQRYYQGDMSRDMPSMDGRSRAVSTDVSDTVEGLMPTLMEIFCGSDDVVQFEPRGPEDVQAAQQETDYVNYVFMAKNPGFMVLYAMIKDALLLKTGIAKVWTEEEEEEERQTYYDQPPDAFAIIKANPEYEIVEQSEHDGLYDLTIVCKTKYKCHYVEAVPPEEFGISRNAREMQTAGYVFHEVQRPQAELIEDGYDADQVKSLPTAALWTNIEETARDTVQEGQSSAGDTMNDANRPIVVTEHYVMVDYEGNGKAQRYRVTTGGSSGAHEILTRGGKPDIGLAERVPFAAITPIPQPHRFIGRSVAELVMDIQQIKTALLRGLLDNSYMAINPRPEVAEAYATETTLDDLLTMRPGMPIRTKQPGGIIWQQVPFVGGELLPVMQFMDAAREWRTGVSRQGQGVDPNALQNQVATIANQMYEASQIKVKMIARIFAETGIRDLFSLLHAEIRENGDKAQTVRLRNQWVTVDPTEWKSRADMSINVGLGTGSKPQQIAQMQLVVQGQQQAVAAGLVSRKNLWNSAKEMIRLIGRKDPETFFVDPSSPPDPNDPSAAPIPPPPDPNAGKAQADMALQAHQAQLQQQKSQVDTQHQAAKAQSDIAIAERKFELDKAKMMLDAEIKAREHQQTMEAQALAMAHKERQHQMDMERQTTDGAMRAREHAVATGAVTPEVQSVLQGMTDQLMAHQQHMATMLHQAVMAPKRIVRDPKSGRAMGVEIVAH